MCRNALCLAIVLAAAFVAQSRAVGATSDPSARDGESPSSRQGAAPVLTSTTTKASSKGNSTGACDSFYNIYGGARETYRGRYNAGPKSMSCNGKQVRCMLRSRVSHALIHAINGVLAGVHPGR